MSSDNNDDGCEPIQTESMANAQGPPVSALRQEIDEIIERFEDAWLASPYPDIAIFLPPDDPHRLTVLRELVHIDLEYRSKAGEVVDPETYLSQFPELTFDLSLAQSFAAAKLLATPLRESTDSPSLEDERSLDSTAIQPFTTDPEDTGLSRGRTGISSSAFNRFRIVRPHAKGGLGQVSVAIDAELPREVALKEIQPRYADDPESRHRFVREAEITGMLEHPGIVPVYGLGTDASGHPFYAMRFIQGESLKDAIQDLYKPPVAGQPVRSATETSLIFRRLLQRFIAVCVAIQYAHHRGILHRDLKPANIMVGKYGETLVVDWGLAKRYNVDLPANTKEDAKSYPQVGDEYETQAGSVIGTPAYMSPEQATGNVDNLGPQSDVYSLGATLYQLLTGHPPFESPSDIFQQVVRGEFTAPRARNPSVSRGLEATCLKAMALNPMKRYTSAGDLADDLERWLSDEPLRAYREPLIDRFARWRRQHRTLVVAVSALLSTLLIATSVGAIVVNNERTRTKIATNKSDANHRAATDIATLIDDIFRSSDPMGMEGFGLRLSTQRAADVTARQILDASAQHVSTRLGEQPEIQAALFETIGNSYRALGDYVAAERFLNESLAIRRKLPHPDQSAVAASLFGLGMIRQDTGNYSEAEYLIRGAINLRLRANEADDLTVARMRLQLAWLLSHQPLAAAQSRDRMLEAEQLVADALTIYRAKLGPNHREVGITLAAFAAVRMGRGDENGMKKYLTEAFLVLDQPQNASDLGLIAVNFMNGEAHRNLRNFETAVTAHRKVVEIARRQLGEDHPMTAIFVANLAGTQRQANDFPGAEKSIREALDIMRKFPMRSQPGILDIFIQYGDELQKRGRLSEAENVYRDAVTFGREGGENSVRSVERANQNLEAVLKLQGKPAVPSN